MIHLLHQLLSTTFITIIRSSNSLHWITNRGIHQNQLGWVQICSWHSSTIIFKNDTQKPTGILLRAKHSCAEWKLQTSTPSYDSSSSPTPFHHTHYHHKTIQFWVTSRGIHQNQLWWVQICSWRSSKNPINAGKLTTIYWTQFFSNKRRRQREQENWQPLMSDS